METGETEMLSSILENTCYSYIRFDWLNVNNTYVYFYASNNNNDDIDNDNEDK